MSFTYDGPGQEHQESLIANGTKITASMVEDSESTTGTANRLAEALETTGETATIDVDDASMFTANSSVIMVDKEQMLVKGVDTGTNPDHIDVSRGYNGSTAVDTAVTDDQIYIVEEFSPDAYVDWTAQKVAPSCVIKFINNHGVSNKGWNPRINGFKIYMKDVTFGDGSKDWRLFAHVNFVKGTYQMFVADDSEIVLEQASDYSTSGKLSTKSTGISVRNRPIDTYLSENLFTEKTTISARYKHAQLVGRRLYIGNIEQGGRTYPDRMIRTPINKFDTFPETNYIDVAVGDGDEITALESFGDRLFQFKKDKVYIINTAGETDVLESEFSNAGIVHPRQVCKTNTGLAWINSTGLWIFDGEKVQNVTRHVEADGYAAEGSTIKMAGFDVRSNRVIYSPSIVAGLASLWYIYDLDLKAYQSYNLGGLFPYHSTAAPYYTNFLNIKEDLVLGYSNATDNTEVNFYAWSNTSKGIGDTTVDNNTDSQGAGLLWKSKDFDFGSPAVRKKIYKVYITYKCTGHSSVQVEYSTDGSATLNDFQENSDYNTTLKKGLVDSSGAWNVAELKPSSSINNVKSFQLALCYRPHHDNDGESGGTFSTTSFELDSTSASSVEFVNYNISLYDGPARYNIRKITGYTNATDIATFTTAFVDNGYSATPSANTKYIVGAVPSDFEINDITIIYRLKPVK